MASRLLGFARDVLIARLLGGGPVADAFLAALRLPNLVRRVLGEGGLNAPFVPIYLNIKAQEGADAARGFAGETLGQLGLLLVLLVALGELFAPWLVLGLAGGFADEPETLAFAAGYTRLMLPFLLFTTLAAMLAALLNAEKRFTVAALAPALMNAILLAMLLVQTAADVRPFAAAHALAFAVSLTGLAHLAMILLALRKTGLPRPALRWSPGMTRLVRTGGATLLAASASQLVLLVSTQVASGEPGAVAALYYADRVFQLPLGFVGVAMGTVVLSDMAQAARGEGQDALLGRTLALGLVLAIPAAAALFVLSDSIVSVLFEHGRFGSEDRDRTAAALEAFAPGLPFAVAAKVFGQAYFVRQRPRLPLLSGCLAVVVAALFGFGLAQARNTAGTAALAATFAFAVQAVILGVALRVTGLWRPNAAEMRPVVAAIAASLIMFGFLFELEKLLAPAMEADDPLALRLSALASLCLGGLCVYGAAGWGLGAFGPISPARLLRKRRG